MVVSSPGKSGSSGAAIAIGEKTETKSVLDSSDSAGKSANKIIIVGNSQKAQVVSQAASPVVKTEGSTAKTGQAQGSGHVHKDNVLPQSLKSDLQDVKVSAESPVKQCKDSVSEKQRQDSSCKKVEKISSSQINQKTESSEVIRKSQEKSDSEKRRDRNERTPSPSKMCSHEKKKNGHKSDSSHKAKSESSSKKERSDKHKSGSSHKSKTHPDKARGGGGGEKKYSPHKKILESKEKYLLKHNPKSHSTSHKPNPPISVPQKVSGAQFQLGTKDHELRKNSHSESKYGKLMHIDVHPNGGASVVHLYQDEISHLSEEDMQGLVKEYFEEVYGEDSEGVPRHVMGIVHGAAAYIPELIEYFAHSYPHLVVKVGVLGKHDIETTTMQRYKEQVDKSYCNGTMRAGPLLQLSLVGTVTEEVGGYLPEFLDLIEQDPFLRASMPWGSLSSVQMPDRSESNDGPILWTRPGEQMVPSADMPNSPFKRKR